MPRQKQKLMEVYELLQQRIEAGEWSDGQFFPTQKEISAEYDVSVSIAKFIIERLQSQGYVKPHGRNTVVRQDRFSVPALVPDFVTWLKTHGRTPKIINVQDIEIGSLSAEEAELFGLPADMQILKRTRIQGEEKGKTFEPYRLAETSYPLAFVEKYLDLVRSDPEFVLINAIRNEYGHVITRSSMSFHARLATRQEQEWLQLTRSAPVLDVYRTSYAQDLETPVMFSHIVWTGYRARVTIKNAETSLK